MMNEYTYPDRKKWAEIIRRPETDYANIRKTVKAILKNVKLKGDRAVRKYTKEFDSTNESGGALTEELKRAIRQAKANIETFHASQKEETKLIETMPGINCWRKAVPIEKVGLYIPGGTAPLFSTVLMLGVPAQLAGCKEVILCSPSSHPAITYAAELCGIKKIFKIGGAQAIAAMAYGTELVPKVQKIFGPGNSYVTLAKQLVQLDGVAIDMPAGPSELLIIADTSAIPSFVAADLLSQAEHGPDSQVILVTTSKELIKEVKKQISLAVNALPRKNLALKSLMQSKVILVESLDDAVEFSNFYAPEHLILACEEISDKVMNAGSVFIGNWSPEAAGDYATGTNHTLPTNGYASCYSGISVESFQKRITYQLLTRKGLRNVGDTVMKMAEAEGLDGHKNAISIRLNYDQ
ncbi:MAG: histidinol dehydrogenase [Chitinophagaceae bacterium]